MLDGWTSGGRSTTAEPQPSGQPPSGAPPITGPAPIPSQPVYADPNVPMSPVHSDEDMLDEPATGPSAPPGPDFPEVHMPQTIPHSPPIMPQPPERRVKFGLKKDEKRQPTQPRPLKSALKPQKVITSKPEEQPVLPTRTLTNRIRKRALHNNADPSHLLMAPMTNNQMRTMTTTLFPTTIAIRDPCWCGIQTSLGTTLRMNRKCVLSRPPSLTTPGRRTTGCGQCYVSPCSEEALAGCQSEGEKGSHNN